MKISAIIVGTMLFMGSTASAYADSSRDCYQQAIDVCSAIHGYGTPAFFECYDRYIENCEQFGSVETLTLNDFRLEDR